MFCCFVSLLIVATAEACERSRARHDYWCIFMGRMSDSLCGFRSANAKMESQAEDMLCFFVSLFDVAAAEGC
jgi:hypothetical protein